MSDIEIHIDGPLFSADWIDDYIRQVNEAMRLTRLGLVNMAPILGSTFTSVSYIPPTDPPTKRKRKHKQKGKRK